MKEKLKDMKNIPVNIAAEILGKSVQYVRVGLQQERLPIGSAVKTSSKWDYHISYELFKEYVGIEKINVYESKHFEGGDINEQSSQLFL